MTKVLAFVKKNAVMTIAFAAALITSFIVPVDEKYLGYFDYKTLACLFCVLAVVCALKTSTSSIFWLKRSWNALKTCGYACLHWFT